MARAESADLGVPWTVIRVGLGVPRRVEFTRRRRRRRLLSGAGLWAVLWVYVRFDPRLGAT